MRKRVLGRFALFAGLSFAVHAAVIGGLYVPLPADEAPQALQARLEAPPSAPPAAPAPRRKAPRRHPAPAATPDLPVVALPVSVPRPDDRVAMTDTAPADIDATAAVAEPAPAELPAPASEPAAADVQQQGMTVVRQLPRHGEIRYQVFYGTNQFSLGSATATWDATDRTYRISSRAETEGLAALFVPTRFSYVSEGQITAAGLQPDALVVSRLRRGRSDDFTTRFDWATHELTLGPPAAARQVALASGTQDIVSFGYQLALLPLAPGRLALTITNGFKLETYEVEVGAEEMLETPLGRLRTIPLRQLRRPNQEGLELWLALDYHQLPVRVRFLDREGRMSGEQLATSIRVSAE